MALANKVSEEINNDELEYVNELPDENNLIIVSGFGPFGGHEIVNASWEAVKQLPKKLHLNGKEYKIETRLIPVEYRAVDEHVKHIWEQKPQLVIHCGVHGSANCVHIETNAYNKNFCRPDYAGCHLSNDTACISSCDDVLSSELNVDKIVNNIAISCDCIRQGVVKKSDTCDIGIDKDDIKVAQVSHDVGGYLCGYIYLKSLDYNKDRTLFVHVPPIDQPFTPTETSAIILEIVKESMLQLHDKMKIEEKTC